MCVCMHVLHPRYSALKWTFIFMAIHTYIKSGHFLYVSQYTSHQKCKQIYYTQKLFLETTDGLAARAIVVVRRIDAATVA